LLRTPQLGAPTTRDRRSPPARSAPPTPRRGAVRPTPRRTRATRPPPGAHRPPNRRAGGRRATPGSRHGTPRSRSSRRSSRRELPKGGAGISKRGRETHHETGPPRLPVLGEPSAARLRRAVHDKVVDNLVRKRAHRRVTVTTSQRVEHRRKKPRPPHRPVKV